MKHQFTTRIAHGARSPHTIAALEAAHYRAEQLDLEDFIDSLNLGHIERIIP
jgi:hypothetical protein